MPTLHHSESAGSMGDDAPTVASTAKKHLSDFQVVKFTYMFNAFFDIKKNGLIELSDIEAFEEKLCEFTGWRKGQLHHSQMLDILSTFHECVKDQVKAEYLCEETEAKDCMISWDEAFKNYRRVQSNQFNTMNLDQWLNMWGRLCYGSAGIADFPIWVQLLPELFFRVADRDDDGIISKQELKNFYKLMSGIANPVTLEKTTNEGYRALTAGGDYILNKENYMFCFANFLLGKGIYGPGKYLFGTFDNREIDEKYTVVYTEECGLDSTWE